MMAEGLEPVIFVVSASMGKEARRSQLRAYLSAWNLDVKEIEKRGRRL